MAIGLLAFGGGMFMTALNISKAWDVNLSKLFVYRLDDLELQLTKPIAANNLIKKIKSIKGVKDVESWQYSSTSFLKDVPYDIVHTYPDKGHGSFVMLAPPVNSTMIKFPLKEGRWVDENAQNEVVLNQIAQVQAPYLKLNDSVALSVFGKASRWKIVGFVQDIGSPAGAAYVSPTSFSMISNTNDLTNMLRISMNSRSWEQIHPKSLEIEDELQKENIAVNINIPMALRGNAVAEHMAVLVSALLAMAILMGLVGVFGLMSTMSMNIYERTRELGVMKAIGAVPKTINKLVVAEGLIIGIMSLFFAFLLSLVLSYFIGNLIGNMSFKTSLPLVVSLKAVIIWIVVILIGSVIATLYPAKRANKITTREALTYE
jgi:putative ABC transport system permease protein